MAPVTNQNPMHMAEAVKMRQGWSRRGFGFTPDYLKTQHSNKSPLIGQSTIDVEDLNQQPSG